MRHQFLDESGKPVDAHFEAEDGALILHSRGGTKGSANALNTEYSEGLRLLLSRATRSGFEIQGVWVDSSRVQSLPPDERQIFFSRDADSPPDELFALLSRRMAAVGRDPNSTGGHGNSNKRLRFEFAGSLTSQQIAEMAGARTVDRDRRSHELLSAAELDRVSANHVWRAVQILKTGEADHRFGESTDYDVITDDGMRLPPKAVFGIAASEALGFEVLPKHFVSGVSSICFRKIKSAGFQIVAKNATPVTEPVPSDPADRMWAEGRPRLVTHLKRERRSGLAEAKKADFLRQHGRLFCERCQIDPKDVYGAEFGDACIEVHHDAIQVSEMDENHEATLTGR